MSFRSTTEISSSQNMQIGATPGTIYIRLEIHLCTEYAVAHLAHAWLQRLCLPCASCDGSDISRLPRLLYRTKFKIPSAVIREVARWTAA